MFSSQYVCLMWFIVKSKLSMALNTLSGLSSSENFSAEASDCSSSEGAHGHAHLAQQCGGAGLKCFKFQARYAFKCSSACRKLALISAVRLRWQFKFYLISVV